MMKVLTYCKECIYWVANNAEEGDWSGTCKRERGAYYGETTDGFDSCTRGEPCDEE